jgi:hypothetical protein
MKQETKESIEHKDKRTLVHDTADYDHDGSSIDMHILSSTRHQSPDIKSSMIDSMTDSTPKKTESDDELVRIDTNNVDYDSCLYNCAKLVNVFRVHLKDQIRKKLNTAEVFCTYVLLASVLASIVTWMWYATSASQVPTFQYTLSQKDMRPNYRLCPIGSKYYSDSLGMSNIYLTTNLTTATSAPLGTIAAYNYELESSSSSDTTQSCSCSSLLASNGYPKSSIKYPTNNSKNSYSNNLVLNQVFSDVMFCGSLGSTTNGSPFADFQGVSIIWGQTQDQLIQLSLSSSTSSWSAGGTKVWTTNRESKIVRIKMFLQHSQGNDYRDFFTIEIESIENLPSSVGCVPYYEKSNGTPTLLTGAYTIAYGGQPCMKFVVNRLVSVVSGKLLFAIVYLQLYVYLFIYHSTVDIDIDFDLNSLLYFLDDAD